MNKKIKLKELCIEDEWDNVVHYVGVLKSYTGVYHLDCFIKLFNN